MFQRNRTITLFKYKNTNVMMINVLTDVITNVCFVVCLPNYYYIPDIQFKASNPKCMYTYTYLLVHILLN